MQILINSSRPNNNTGSGDNPSRLRAKRPGPRLHPDPLTESLDRLDHSASTSKEQLTDQQPQGFHPSGGKTLGMRDKKIAMNNAKPTQKILLYGNSVLIESLTSKLQKIEGWEVKRREGGEVREIDQANFIVTDLCDVTNSEALPMLSALPGVMLVGVDALANTLTVLTGRSHPLNAMQDVLDELKKAM